MNLLLPRPLNRALCLLASVVVSLAAVFASSSAHAAMPAWVMTGPAYSVASSSNFPTAGTAFFPRAIKEAQSKAPFLQYYVLPATFVDGQYWYSPNIRVNGAATVVAWGIAFNAPAHEYLLAVGETGRDQGGSVSPATSGYKSGNLDTQWKNSQGTIMAEVQDSEGFDYNTSTNTISNLSVNNGTHNCSWSGFGYAPYSGITNNGTSAAKAYVGTDFSCSNGHCEIDYNPNELDGFLTYWGRDASTHIFSPDNSTNCSSLYSPVYNFSSSG